MYDYHVHSNFSYDAETPMDDIIRRAIELELDEIAITDHFDPEYADPAYTVDLDFAGYHSALDRVAAKYSGKIRVVRGIELGMQSGQPNALCAEAASGYPYDFIIGSIHCACGAAIDIPDYLTDRDSRQAREDYYGALLQCVTEFTDFDVVGHINVIERYLDRTPRDGDFKDIIDEILKKLVDDGKGIEINTSSFRYGMGERTTPTPDILKRYVSLGGEIITTGSDAHRLRDVGHMLNRAEQMIRDAGLNYLATFKGRKAVMVRV
jgi:histidinol-phosphatase (PHP family)